MTLGERHLLYWTSHLASPVFVYVLRAEGDTAIKIGIASDVRARVAVLQTGNPRPLRILRVIPASQPFEALLHRYMAGCRLTGEWFDGSRVEHLLDKLASMAEAMVASHNGGEVPPNYTDFTDWIPLRLRRPQTLRERSGEITVRHVQPDPVPADVAERRTRERWLRPWEKLPDQAGR